MTAAELTVSEHQARADTALAWLRARVREIEQAAAAVGPDDISPPTHYQHRYVVQLSPQMLGPSKPFVLGYDLPQPETTLDELRALLDVYDATCAELAEARRQLDGMRPEWTLGDDVEPYDSTHIMREADARHFADDPDCENYLYRRPVGDWERVDREAPASDRDG